MPTAAHVVYIPAVLLIGIVIGFFLGGRAARDEAASAQKRTEARAARAARRAERDSGQNLPPPSEGGSASS